MAEEEKKRFLEGNEIELGEKQGRHFSPPRSTTPKMPATIQNWQNNPILPVISYCASSILMTVANKYILSFPDYNLNFLLLAVQVREHRVSFREYSLIANTVNRLYCRNSELQDRRSNLLPRLQDWWSEEMYDSIMIQNWNCDWQYIGFPISLLLIGMIYTSTKALRFLSIPVYTIFKNLTIILIAYGEVLWFGGSVSSMALFSFGLMVLSSIIAAWADIKHALESHSVNSATTAHMSELNAGYIWMMVNCLSTAAYVLGMRKRIKLTNFKDFDSKYKSLAHPR